jgi:hypothetical protein
VAVDGAAGWSYCQRLPDADEAAGSVAILTYPESDYISGQVTITGGGFEG